MNKTKLLLENFCVYGLGQMIYKIIPLVMIPILTRIIPESEYYMGINDLTNIVISLTSVFGLLGMYDAMFRLCFDYDSNEEKAFVCSNALHVTVGASVIVAAIIIVLKKHVSLIAFDDDALSYLVVICAISMIIENCCIVVATPTRMKNERIPYIVGNTLRAIIMYVSAIILINSAEYITALPLGNLVAAFCYLIYFRVRNKQWFKINCFNKNIIKDLLKIGIPLFPTFIVFWIYSSIDRLMILHMLGVEANGVYSTANKFAMISQLLTSGFAMGWSYFNFRTMRDDSHAKDVTTILSVLLGIGVLSFCACRILAESILIIILPKGYEDAGIIMPYLYLVPIVNLIFQLMGSQFLIIKKSYWTTIISSLGAGINMILNYVMISIWGAVGASYATLISYFVIIIVAYMILKKKGMLINNCKMIMVGIMTHIILISDMAEVSNTISVILCEVNIILLSVILGKDVLTVLKSVRKKGKENG